MSTADRRSPPCSPSCTTILRTSDSLALVLLPSPPLTAGCCIVTSSWPWPAFITQQSNISRTSLSGLKASCMSRNPISLIKLRRQGNFVVEDDLIHRSRLSRGRSSNRNVSGALSKDDMLLGGCKAESRQSQHLAQIGQTFSLSK